VTSNDDDTWAEIFATQPEQRRPEAAADAVAAAPTRRSRREGFDRPVRRRSGRGAVVAGVLALLLRAPFLVVVGVAAGSAALVRAVG